MDGLLMMSLVIAYLMCGGIIATFLVTLSGRADLKVWLAIAVGWFPMLIWFGTKFVGPVALAFVRHYIVAITIVLLIIALIVMVVPK